MENKTAFDLDDRVVIEDKSDDYYGAIGKVEVIDLKTGEALVKMHENGRKLIFHIDKLEKLA